MSAYLPGLALYVLCLVLIAWIGWRGVANVADYVLGGRRLNWFTTAMSAGATGMSGWIMLGLPGEAYSVGGGVLWLVLGLALGMTGNWLLVARRLRALSEKAGDALTLPVFLSVRAGAAEADGWRSVPSLVRRCSGISILIFLGLYAATGMVAGGKLLDSVFGLQYQLGVLLISAMVLLYSLLGGFLSISWTDVLQALLMFLVLSITAVLASGVDVSAVRLADDYYSLLRNADGTAIGLVAVVSGLSWGLGYFGQPHILARFMAMRSPQQQRGAFPLATSWSILGMLCAVSVGISAREQLQLADAETALLVFIEILYNPWVGGFALAAVLAAIMSTADSQLLVAGTAFTHDLLDGERKRSLRLDRLAIAGIAVGATGLAMAPDSSVFSLVSYAWAGLGAAFGPSVLLSLFWRRLTGLGILLSVVSGTVLVFAWEHIPGAAATGLYVLFPAFVLSLTVAIAASLLDGRPTQEAALSTETAEQRP